MAKIVAASSKTKATFFQRARQVLLAILSIYLLFVLLVMFYQRRLLYFPTQLQPEVAEQMALRENLVPWRNDSGKVIGWKLLATESATASVLVVHGNGGCALDRSYFAKPIHDAAPVDVYILEYPGYGAREGSPSEKSFVAAAKEALNLLPNKEPVYIVGESLGAGVAAALAKEHETKVKGIMLFVPYNNLISLAQEKMPFLPIRIILRDRFDPAAGLKDYRGPVGFVIAEKDEIIPAKFGLALHESYPGPKILQVIPGAEHNGVSSQPAEWWKNIFSFWRENGKQLNSAANP